MDMSQTRLAIVGAMAAAALFADMPSVRAQSRVPLQYVASDAVPALVNVPSNLIVSDTYRPVVERMLRYSRTFRRQCVRIASEHGLTVRLTFRTKLPRPDVNAITTIQRQPTRGIVADIAVLIPGGEVELIAHEIEHVIEQLDEIDLPLLARVPGSGVRALAPERSMYETRRAARVGALVAAEVVALSPER